MTIRSAMLALSASSVLMLTNCGGPSSPSSYQNVTITITPQITSLPINGTQTFTATVTNAPSSALSWQMSRSDGSGTLTGSSGSGGIGASGTTVTYTAPATPPIYQARFGLNAENVNYNYPDQGIATVTAFIMQPGGNLLQNFAAFASVPIAIIGPVSAGISPTTATVKLGSSTSFSGYCVGAASNNLIWQVNGVAGGSAATGTIVAGLTYTYLYTAPAAMPVTGNTVTVTAVCQADSTKSASATVTLTQ